MSELHCVGLLYLIDILGLQAFLRDEIKLGAGNGSYVEQIWEKFNINII